MYVFVSFVCMIVCVYQYAFDCLECLVCLLCSLCTVSALMVLGRLHSWITFHLSSLLDRVSAACPFNRAGQLRSQQLIGLRKSAYQSLRCAFRASRLATCIMLKSYPSLTSTSLYCGIS